MTLTEQIQEAARLINAASEANGAGLHDEAYQRLNELEALLQEEVTDEPAGPEKTGDACPQCGHIPQG